MQPLTHSLFFIFIILFSISDTSEDNSSCESVPPRTKEPKKKRKLGAPKAQKNVATSDITFLPTPASTISSVPASFPAPAPVVVVSPPQAKENTVEMSQPAKRAKGSNFGQTDLRSQYAGIFAQAFNNFDKVEFGGILNKYCDQDLLVVYELIGPNPFNSPKYLEVRGVDTVLVFWESLFTTIPDSLFTVHSTRYKVLPNDYTSVVCAFSFQGTKVYNMAGVENNTSKNVVITQDAQAPKGKLIASVVAQDKLHELDLHHNDIHREGSSHQDFSVQRSKMISTAVTILGTLTFYVNADQKIYRIAFVHSVKS